MLTTSAAELLRHEADAIAAAADRLDAARFSEAVEILASCAGAVATTGAGTSGIVARKIAVTLTSTGTRALFVHPTDALHGGLGVIGHQDVVIAVSNSGESEEVCALLPYLRVREVKIIAIVGNLGSTLARQAEVVLDAFAEEEAGPHGIVPTASIAVALAIGDALALTVMEMKGITSEAFAANHPSGQLGRRLTLHVRDVMHQGSGQPAVGPKAVLLEIVRAITDSGLGAVNVVDDQRRLLGIITDGDVRRTLQHCDHTQLGGLHADEIMTPEPVITTPDAMAYDALRLMENRPSQIAVLPVVDDGECVGLLRLHDLVRIGL